ncbi:TPA: hypothetical protein ME922_005207, partial [Klebsiella pneumoniae]|nr:hypothetical protein [Klebsiella pneumoniae]HBW4835104.1 hypothetical protein [Klebsiella pneumoniae]HBW4883983.1 hypothetical protein [Klebsiella pneumoniae]HBW4978278.1 hypothetical protein [Klebsiella pneumoniae]HBW5165719.1 hypothetical protein [Klebsiella pneumoniae]
MWLHAGEFQPRLQGCAVRAIPTFPRYRLAKPPVAKRWLGGGAALVLLSGIIAAMAGKSGANTSIILFCMVGMVLLGGVVWFVRTIFFRLSVHHSHTWEREAENERRHWWEIHRRQFALKDIVLIGPAGAEFSDWLRVIKREHQAPLVRQESLGKSLRIARSFSSALIEREKQLAQMLVLQWKRQRGKELFVSPEKYFWQGSPEAWQAFVAQLIESFPGITAPELPEIWQGEKTLSLLANVLADKKQLVNFLIAGCQSLSPASDSTRPDGECAVLWLAGNQGDVTLSRGEFFEPY